MHAIVAAFRRLGPGLVTASVVLGPGSIIASSRAGAEGAYAYVWVLVFGCLLMAVFTSMGARLGCALDVTPIQYIANRAGRWLGFILGLSGYLVTAGFQFGNNLGVSFAAHGVTGAPLWIWPLAFTAASLAFLFWARQVYKWVERLMMALVAIMIVAFFANLWWTGFSPTALASGFLPRMTAVDPIILAALVGTNCSAVAAFYQAYLVKAKGWTRADLPAAIRDAWIGIAILGAIALAIMIGTAESLHGREAEFRDVGQLARQLESILGPASHVVFSLGLGAAAFSSFIVNALIGGSMLADGLGLDPRLDARPAKSLAASVMLIGCGVALATLLQQQGNTTSLLVAQASTLIAAPLAAATLLALTSSSRIMGALRSSPLAIATAAIGLAVILWLAVRTILGWI